MSRRTHCVDHTTSGNSLCPVARRTVRAMHSHVFWPKPANASHRPPSIPIDTTLLRIHVDERSRRATWAPALESRSYNLQRRSIHPVESQHHSEPDSTGDRRAEKHHTGVVAHSVGMCRTAATVVRNLKIDMRKEFETYRDRLFSGEICPSHVGGHWIRGYPRVNAVSMIPFRFDPMRFFCTSNHHQLVLSGMMLRKSFRNN